MSTVMKFLDKHGKKLLRIAGFTVAIVSVYFLVSGIYLLSQGSTSKDSEEYYSTWHFRLESDSSAVVLAPDGIQFDGAGGRDMGEMGTFKTEVYAIDTSKAVFIGVGDEGDICNYLEGVDHDAITRLHLLPMSASYGEYGGTESPGDPDGMDFWLNAKSGQGTQSVIWNPERDDLSLVLMNADGSAGIEMDVLIKTQMAILFIVGVINLMVGIFLLLLSLIAISGTSRKSRNPTFAVPVVMLPSEEDKGEGK